MIRFTVFQHRCSFLQIFSVCHLNKPLYLNDIYGNLHDFLPMYNRKTLFFYPTLHSKQPGGLSMNTTQPVSFTKKWERKIKLQIQPMLFLDLHLTTTDEFFYKPSKNKKKKETKNTNEQNTFSTLNKVILSSVSLTAEAKTS